MSNINRGLRCSDISDRDRSNKDGHRFSNLRDKGNPCKNILNPGASSNAGRNHNTNGLKENLKEEMQNIESSGTRSLKTLASKGYPKSESSGSRESLFFEHSYYL